MTNDVAENGAIRVRFTHYGIEFAGARRPICAPGKARFTMVKDIEKVTCPHCKRELEKFFAYMEGRPYVDPFPEEEEGEA